MKRFFSLVFIVIIYACEAIIEVEDISNEEVVLLAPADNTVIDFTTVHFYWEPIEEDSVHYQIQVATPTFEEAVEIVIDSTILYHEFSAELEENPYEWRVRAINEAYETKYSTNSFIIQNNPGASQ